MQEKYENGVVSPRQVQCQVCFKIMNNVTHTHLKSKHCNDVVKSIKEYQEMFPNCAVKSQFTNETLKVTLENMIYRYGEEEGKKKFQIYCDKQAKTNTFEYKQEKFGMTEEEFRAYNKSRSVTLENCIKRHGKKKGTKVFEDYCKKQAYAGVTLEYYIEKYGEDEGPALYQEMNLKKINNLDSFIARHGEEEGTKKYKEYVSKRGNMFYSQLQFDFQKKLIDYINLKGYEGIISCVNIEGKESFIFSKDKIIFIDFTFETNKGKIAVEIHGDFWHASPLKYEEDSLLNFGGTTGKKLAKEIWKKDKLKESIIREEYELEIVWENEINANEEEALQRCYKLIDSIT